MSWLLVYWFLGDATRHRVALYESQEVCTQAGRQLKAVSSPPIETACEHVDATTQPPIVRDR
jgi:hypothetical protein